MIIPAEYTNRGVFHDRREAGRQLAEILEPHAKKGTYLLALPRGGVEVAYEVAKKLSLPLDVLIVRKIGAPYNPEFAVGALAEEDVQVLDHDILDKLNLTSDDLHQVIKDEQDELKRRQELYRDGRSLEKLEDKTIILIDDGLATGHTARAAIQSAKKLQPKTLIFAAPVCAGDSIDALSKKLDSVECLTKPYDLGAIGRYYHRFGQTTDETVQKLLNQAKNTYGQSHRENKTN